MRAGSVSGPAPPHTIFQETKSEKTVVCAGSASTCQSGRRPRKISGSESASAKSQVRPNKKRGTETGSTSASRTGT